MTKNTNKTYPRDKRSESALRGIAHARRLIAEANGIAPEDLITIRTASRELGYSRQWLHQRINRGDFEVYGDGKRRFLYRPQIFTKLNITK